MNTTPFLAQKTHFKDPIAHIVYLKKERPEIYAKTYKFLDAKDYLNFKLTGKFSASFDSIHLLWSTDARDLSNITYDRKLLKYMGMDIDKFPELIKPTDVLGLLLPAVAKEIGLEDPGTVTKSGMILGTPHYFAPEAIEGARKKRRLFLSSLFPAPHSRH